MQYFERARIFTLIQILRYELTTVYSCPGMGPHADLPREKFRRKMAARANLSQKTSSRRVFFPRNSNELRFRLRRDAFLPW